MINRYGRAGMIRTLKRVRVLNWAALIRRVRSTYKSELHHPLHLFRPRRFTEKMQWRKLFDLDPAYAVFCDKVATREYVAQRVGSNALVPMLWLGRDPAALPLETLRPPYIIKCSHGSGWNIVVRGNDAMDYGAMRAQLGRWLATDFGIEFIEPGYSAVPPQLFIEPLLTDRGGFPREYKFFMFNGVARLVMLRANFGDLTDDRVQSYYDMQWRLLPLRTADMPSTTSVPCPPEFNTMCVMAEKLARDRDHIRVDFLVTDGRVYVGELTSYHRRGIFRFEPDHWDYVLGEYWQLKRPLMRAFWTIVTRYWGITKRYARTN